MQRNFYKSHGVHKTLLTFPVKLALRILSQLLHKTGVGTLPLPTLELTTRYSLPETNFFLFIFVCLINSGIASSRGNEEKWLQIYNRERTNKALIFTLNKKKMIINKLLF